MDTVQLLCRLRDVSSFLDVFPSDLLPHSITQTTTTTVIINADPHTEGGSLWLGVHFRPKSSSAYYFDSYDIVLLVPSIQEFIKRNCATWEYNRRQLQGLTTDVCEKYCRLFISLFNACKAADQQVELLFTAEFGAQMSRGVWGQCCRSCL